MKQSSWRDEIRTFFRADVLLECPGRVAKENIRMMCLLDIITMIFSFLIACYGLFSEGNRYVFEMIYVVFFLIAAALFMFAKVVDSKRNELIGPLILVNYLVWVIYFIVENVFYRPHTYITSYYTLMGLGLFFLIKPAYVVLELFMTGVMIGVCIVLYESPVYVQTDLVNAMVMIFVGTVLSLVVLEFRMSALKKSLEREKHLQVAALYQTIVDETQTGVCVRELGTYNMLYFNREAKKIFGFAGEDVEGKKCYELLRRVNVPCNGCRAEQNRGEIAREKEVELNGRYYDVKGRIIDWNGKEACIEYLVDVTAAKKVEEQMRVAHEELRKKYEEELVYREKAVSEDIISTSRVNLTQGIVEEMRVGKTDGYENQYRNELDFRRRIHAFARDMWLTDEQNQRLSKAGLIAAFEAGGTSVSEEYVAELKDGKHVWIRVEVSLLPRPETSEIMAFIYNRDITRERLLRYSIEHVMSFGYDEIYTVDRVNESFAPVAVGEYVVGEQQSEGKYAQELNRLVDRAVLKEDKEKIRREMNLGRLCTSLERERTHVLEVLLLSQNGKSRRKQIRCTYLDQEVGILLITVMDIEDVVNQEREKQRQLEEALAMMREANRAKSNFLASMSHEIRTPMNAIIGLNAIIKDEIENRAQVLDCTEKLDSASRYLLALLNDILDMSRIESGNMTLARQPFDGDKLWDNINILAKAQADMASVHYVFEREQENVGAYVGDETRLQQIMINLINNAIKFTPENGCVKVTVKENMTEDGRMKGMVTVEDNGIGISEEFLPRVFGTFTQEHDGSTTAYKGSGLGLSIARNFARMMDGDITVQSEEGVGTKFVVEVTLDVAQETVGIENGEEADTERDFTGRKVLLVEDHPLNTIVAKSLLSKRGFEVTTAENGEEAVHCFKENAPGSFDAVLMDIRMPILDGIGATKQIRAMNREDAKIIPIIAMTANAYEEDRRRTAEAGMNAHLAKPIDPKQLFKTLDKFISA